MKKREQKVTTEHFDAVLVTHEPEEKDLVTGPAMLPEDYLLIGPPGGALARIEGMEVALLYTLLQQLHVGGRRARVIGPIGPGCGFGA